MWRMIKENAAGAAGIAAGGLLGLLLLFFPQTTADAVLYIFGIALILIGAVRSVQYFRMDVRSAISSRQLALGVLLIFAGVMVLVFSESFISFFPFVLGCVLFIGGIAKLQSAFDLKRMGVAKWYYDLFGVLVSLLFGLIILLNPFSAAMTLMRVIGAALVIEVVQDVICAVRFCRFEKKFRS
mgnify:CR=1 FL=1